MRRALVGLALALGAGILSGCAGDDCDADTQTLATCGGDLIDSDTWESGPIDGAYLDFHGERTWVFNPSGWMGSREPIAFNVYLSLDAEPNADGGGGFADPAGNLAQITTPKVGGGYQVQLLNNTCAQYYLRVVVTYAPSKGGGAPMCKADGG